MDIQHTHNQVVGHSGSGKMCAACEKPLTDDGFFAMGALYHQACFRLAPCGMIWDIVAIETRIITRAMWSRSDRKIPMQRTSIGRFRSKTGNRNAEKNSSLWFLPKESIGFDRQRRTPVTICQFLMMTHFRILNISLHIHVQVFQF